MRYELYHYGVPGMKWGVQKSREAGYELDRRKRELRRAKFTRSVSMLRKESEESIAAKNTNVAKAQEVYERAKQEYKENAAAQAKYQRGVRKTMTAMATVGAVYIADKKYLGGVITKSTKIAASAAIKVVGLATVTAVKVVMK